MGQLDTVAIEAMVCGRPVVHSLHDKYFPNCPHDRLKTVEEACEVISKLLLDYKERRRRIENQLKYVNAVHSAPILVKKLIKIYEELVGT